MSLDQPIKTITGVGVSKAKDFERIGVSTVEDALFDFPFRYDDLSSQKPISGIKNKEKVTVRGTISSIKNRRSKDNKRIVITEALVEDGTGSIKAVWFHQGFLTKSLKTGVQVALSGKTEDKFGLTLVNPLYEILGNAKITKHTGRILPIYRLSGALTQKIRRVAAEGALKFVGELEDWVPENIQKGEGFIDLDDAVRAMHFPNNQEDVDRALSRLKFDEFFLHQLLHAQVRRELKKEKAPAIKFSEAEVKEFISSLPFELTNAQKKASWAIIKDMERSEPMNRLLEGDVGSGKTVVAAIAARNASASGWQSVILAPTEILADQHGHSLEKLLGGKMNIAVFTRSVQRINGREVTREEMLEGLKNGYIDLAVGTHTLLSKSVLFKRLGLIVVDEQHRFGVNQRKSLKDREGDIDGIPHLLSMTATPIPRSLALVMYGDLDRSILDEYPVGRKPIKTSIVFDDTEEDVYDIMCDEMDAGRQVFVVAPLIEESDMLGAKSVEEVYTHFAEGPFRAYRVGTLHGKMKTQERDDVMARFVNGEIDMIIATTVVEVGVDIPNATVMFIEGAERFGLSQLHQLRGRVGRSDMASYCFLHPTEDMSELANKRLQAVVLSQNGFDLADKDLELRGPGNIFGTQQSGFEIFKLGSFADRDLMGAAKDYAKDIMDEDPTLEQWPRLKEKVDAYMEDTHFE